MPDVPQNRLQEFQTFNASIPKEGPKCVPVAFDFTTASTYRLDLSSIQQRAFISLVQTLYIDNSLNDVQLMVVCGISNQVIIAPPNTQGYYAILAPNLFACTITCVGGNNATTIFFINVPISGSVWGGAASTSGGTQLVADTILDATVTGNRVQVLEYETADGGLIVPRLLANNTVFGQPADSTGALVIGAPGYFLRNLTYSVSGAVPAGVIVQLADSATAQTICFFILDTNGTFSIPLSWNNKVAASQCYFSFSAPLTAGLFTFTLQYGICSFVG